MKVEDVDVKCLKDYPVKPMSPEISEIFMGVILMGNQGKPVPDEIKSQTGYKIMDSRLEWAGYEDRDEKVLAFLTFLCINPGTCVMWAWTIFKLNIKNFDDLVNAFATGFPDEDSYRECWDAQKGFNNGVDVDNLLDRREIWVRK